MPAILAVVADAFVVFVAKLIANGRYERAELGPDVTQCTIAIFPYDSAEISSEFYIAERRLHSSSCCAPAYYREKPIVQAGYPQLLKLHAPANLPPSLTSNALPLPHRRGTTS